MLACLLRKLTFVRLLLQANASLDHTIMGGVSVIHMAAETGFDDVLACCIDVFPEETHRLANVCTDAGQLAIELAAGMGHDQCVKVLQSLTRGFEQEAEIRQMMARAQVRVAKEQAEQPLSEPGPGKPQATKCPTKASLTLPILSRPLSEAELAAAQVAKEAGNVAFLAKDFSAAILHYTEAIALNPVEAVYYTNRCAAYLGNEETTKAVVDARMAQKLKPDSVKAVFREAQCLEKLGQFEEASYVFWDAYKLDPTDKSLKKRFHACVARGRKAFQEQASEQ